jgi:hypothetical protein
MERMGHSSTRAALIYLHGGAERQRTIADAVSELAHGPQAGCRSDLSGMNLARRKRPDHVIIDRSHSISNQDYLLMQALFLMITVAVLVAVLAVDMLTVLDPRTRDAG